MLSNLLAFAIEFPAVSTVLGWVLFGCIGTIAVGYAKMKDEWPPAVLGVALMVYPYFFPRGVFFWSLGIGLTLLLLVPKRLLGF